MVTMLDVARRAGVTKQTVSNVVRGRAIVSAETKAKVEAAIAELGYTPNLVARSLATGTTMTIGFIVPTIANPFYSEVVEVVETLLEEHGYHLLLATTRGDGERARRHLATLSNRSVDALLVAGDFDLSEHVPLLGEYGLPVALCAWEIDPPDTLPVVTIDYEKAGYLAGRHLRELGHQRLVSIAELPAHRVRVGGAHRAFAEDGIVVTDDSVFAIPDSTPESGYEAALLALSADRTADRTTAVFASTDAIALGVMEAVRHNGLRVPEDVSVVGIDDIPQAAHAHPPLTTVALPKRRMAQEATGLLLRGIAENQPPSPSLTLLSPEVLVRASSAPPAG
ncbi:LacI family DNA-binding transcriptional regulator [Actinacidiphila oryziradicis]|uniref:LacI family transcriptional regulator n=1 Tax=Actinacidiphila oryziradicis TaxID=2571141 RepID=A0A4U0SGE7_9ACTN|nr:LacI family DNA-binding transcriptional regulator [Actinacidiphila oryziradicis]TKA08684.1 LacI family transcriptional regulator [Actinacidiphila oryziradicis]